MMYNLGLEIKNLNNVIHRNFANLKSVSLLDEITGSNGYILSFLCDHNDELITQKKIEEMLGITRSTASTVLSRMEKNDLIRREVLPSDSRMKRIIMTDKGHEIITLVRQEIQEFEKTLIKGFSEEELQQFISFIKKIKTNILEENI